MNGEYPPARRKSGRRTRGRRAAAVADPDGPPDPDGSYAAGLDGTGTGAGNGEDPAPAQPAWSDEWTAQDKQAKREKREREKNEPPEDPESRARQICLNQLSYAPKTRSQLREALLKRDVPEDVADEVLSRFADVGLIDDAAFAKAWVESRHHSKGLSGRALKAELRRRGVGSDDINEAVAALDPDEETETARRLVERKLSSTRGLPTETRTRRLAGMLARKGYPAGLSFRIIREALDAEGVAGEEAEAVLGEDTPGDWY